MQGKNAQLDASRELPYISQIPTQGPYLATLFQRIVDAVNQTAKNLGSSSIGKLEPPEPIDSVNVQGTTQKNNTIIAPSELLHWTITHNSPLKKGVQYISEISTSSSFSQPHIVDHGCSRSGFLHLPAQDNNGIVQKYFLRSYAQMPGSDPTKPTVVGGLVQPTAIVMTGTSKTSLLPSTGSGTAAANGTQGGHGLGKVLDRPAPQTKRSLV